MTYANPDEYANLTATEILQYLHEQRDGYAWFLKEHPNSKDRDEHEARLVEVLRLLRGLENMNRNKCQNDDLHVWVAAGSVTHGHVADVCTNCGEY